MLKHIHIEGEDNILNDEEEDNEENEGQFLADLMQVGPFAK
jgi:hypothetical protein